MTVIDQAKPWLMPSRAFAAITHFQLGAQMIMNGTGSNQPAQNKHPLASPSVGQLAGNKVGAGLHHAEADDERDDQSGRTDPKLLGADQRHNGALDPNHATDKGIDQDKQGELRPVLLQAEPD